MMVVMVGAIRPAPKGVVRSDNDRRRSVFDNYRLSPGLGDRPRGRRLLHGRDDSRAHPAVEAGSDRSPATAGQLHASGHG